MFSESAHLYDLIYSSFKDYGQEAREIAALLRRIHPPCRSVLDVACGTGEHARLLATGHGFEVDGLDLDPRFVEIAIAKHPAGRFWQADMAAFALGARYDAVLCLFSSIAYVRTLERVRQALACFRAHLKQGGVIVVEPWFPPGALDPAYRDTRTVESGGTLIRRTGRTEVEGTLSRIIFEYQIQEGSQTRHLTEMHELGLFSTEELRQCFAEAGLGTHYDPHGLTGRGLFVATTTG